MTDSNKTHITLVVDRSGSMMSVQQEAESGVNEFINSQKAGPGTCTLTLKQFNTIHDQLYHGDIQDAPTYSLQPAGMTALHDAIGIAINETGKRLADLPEDERPGRVAFVVQTDGLENSSREFVLNRLKELIKRQETQYSWEFVFLGMGLEVAEQGYDLGFRNVTQSAASGQAYRSTYSHTGAVMDSWRKGEVANLAAASVTVDDEGNITQE